MAKKSGRDDVQLEEISKLQTELAQLQADLMDSVNINDELSKVIIVKDEEIQDKAERLVALKEQNEADGEQLELEQLTLSDRCQYEISTKEETLRKLGLQHKRFRDTSEENAELKVSVRDTGDRTEVNGELHATTMHLKNLEMKTLREVMERKMRDQLNKMDISYQKEAFAALSEVHKKSMFQNAKLKDEVALQGVGLNNLGTRLAKQNQKYTLTRSELHSLHVKSRALKEALGKITGEKRQLARDKEVALEDQHLLYSARAALEGALGAEPQFLECLQLRKELHTHTLEAQCDVVMWAERQRKLRLVHQEIKPVNEREKRGRFNSVAFPLDIGVSVHSLVGSEVASRSHHHSTDSVMDAATGTGADAGAGEEVTGVSFASLPTSTHTEGEHSLHTSSMAFKASDIVTLMQQDPTLAAALSVLQGREGALLNNHAKDDRSKDRKCQKDQDLKAQEDQNMIAWITLQVVDVWASTKNERNCVRTEKRALLEELFAVQQAEQQQIQERRGRREVGSLFQTGTSLGIADVGGIGITEDSMSFQPFQDVLHSVAETEREGSEQGSGQGSGQGQGQEQGQEQEHESKEAQPQSSPPGHAPTDPPPSTHSPTHVPPLNLASPVAVSGLGWDSQSSRQRERDFIEGGELDEDQVQALWDRAFHSGVRDLDRHKEVPWLKPVPAARRFPPNSVELVAAHVLAAATKANALRDGSKSLGQGKSNTMSNTMRDIRSSGNRGSGRGGLTSWGSVEDSRSPATAPSPTTLTNTQLSAMDISYWEERPRTEVLPARRLSVHDLRLLNAPQIRAETEVYAHFVAPPIILMEAEPPHRGRSLVPLAIPKIQRGKLGLERDVRESRGRESREDRGDRGEREDSEGVLSDPLMGRKFAQSRRAAVAAMRRSASAVSTSTSTRAATPLTLTAPNPTNPRMHSAGINRMGESMGGKSAHTRAQSASGPLLNK